MQSNYRQRGIGEVDNDNPSRAERAKTETINKYSSMGN